MEVKAIVLIVGSPVGDANALPASFAGAPLALADVMGRPAIHHLVRNLKQQNVSEVAVISEAPMPTLNTGARQEHNGINWTLADGAQLWRTAESTFNELAQSGAEEIIVLRMGAYVEPDIDSLLQAHMDNGTRATRAVNRRGEQMDLFVLTGSRRNDAAYLFRHRLLETRTRCGSWRFQGYSNTLETPQHLRCMAVDALLGENKIVPDGKQVRPGVWVARSASIHPRARVLSPAYIGEHARIRANAVVTRCSVIEHHAEVDYGTVVEDATVMPFTYVGPGLDMMHAVVGSGRVVSLERHAEVEIADPRLMRSLSPNAGRRAISQAAALATFLPAQFIRGLFSSTRRNKPAELPAAVSAPSSLNTPAGFPAATSAVEASSYQRTWQ